MWTVSVPDTSVSKLASVCQMSDVKHTVQDMQKSKPLTKITEILPEYTEYIYNI